MDAFSIHEGTPYQYRNGEEARDVYSIELDYGASVLSGASMDPAIIEPVYTIAGSGQYRREDEPWRTGTGTGLRVARSSIPALLRVLSDIMEHDPQF